MPIHVPLLFHLNQNLTEHASAASRAAYKGLLRVLRSHPTIPVNIHISGTLVNALQWLDPEPLQLIWEGLRAGQFELLGSTYAQSVPYSSDDWDTARQIELHLKVLHDVFGVTPVTFWSPQRTWRQDLLPLIAGNGYRFTLVEDHILADAHLAEPVVVTSQVGAHILTLLYDDHLLRHLFNFAVWFGRPRQLQVYLAKRAEHPNVSAHCLTYAGNAAAMGMWGWQNGIVPNQTWHRLDQLLTLLEALPEVELIHLTNAPASAGNLSPIPDGNSMALNAQLKTLQTSAEGQTDGEEFEDWFDYNARSSTLNTFRDYYAGLRTELRAFAEKLEGEKRSSKIKAAQNIYNTALHNYLAHQFKFGSVDTGSKGYWGWEGAEATRPILRVAELALKQEATVSEEQLTSAARPEVVLSDGRNALILTPAGGRILYWFDLSNGKQYMGNQLAVGLAPYENDAALPQRTTLPYENKLPDDYRPQPLLPGARLTAESAPTRMGDYLPEWVWEAERGPFELLICEQDQTAERRSLPVQRRGFTDYIEIDGRDAGSAGEWFETTVEGEAVAFACAFGKELALQKRYTWANGLPQVQYTWQNHSKEDLNIRWCAITELTPDYASIQVKGRKALQFSEAEGVAILRNTAAKEEVRLISEPAPNASHFNEGLLALEVVLSYNFLLPAGERQEVTITLQRASTRARD